MIKNNTNTDGDYFETLGRKRKDKSNLLPWDNFPESNIDDKEPTIEEFNAYCEKLVNKLKQNPKWELQLELGKMLMRNIDTFTVEERKRYDELLILLKEE